MASYTVRELIQLDSTIDQIDKAAAELKGEPIFDADKKVVGHKHLSFGLDRRFHVVAAIAKGHVAPHVNAYNKMQRDILGRHSGGKGTLSVDSDKWLAYQNEISAELDAVVDLEFKKFSVSSLPEVESETVRLLPGSALAMLAPILQFE